MAHKPHMLLWNLFEAIRLPLSLPTSLPAGISDNR